MKVISFCFSIIFILIFCNKITAQKINHVLYSNEFGILGRTETILIPENNYYILQENYLGALGGYVTDTLFAQGEVLKGNKFEITITKKNTKFRYLGENGRIKKIRFKEYQKCDPFINYKLNWWYAWDIFHKSDEIAKAKLGNSNPDWERRQKHTIEYLYEKGAYSNNSEFAKHCYNDFKLIVDTVNKTKLIFLENIVVSTKK